MQAGLVEVLLVFFSTVVVGEDLAEIGVNLGVNVTFSLDLFLDLVEDLDAVMMLSQVELLFSLSDSAKEDSIFV